MAAKETVGDLIRRHRRRFGPEFTQEKLAEVAGVARGYIADLESNAVTVPRDPVKLRKVAKALKVPFRTLTAPTGWNDDEERKVPAQVTIEGRNFDGFDDSTVGILLDLAERLAPKKNQ